MEVEQALKEYKRNLTLDEGKVLQLRKSLSDYAQRLSAMEEDTKVKEEAIKVLQALEGAWHKTFEKRLANLVSRGLTLVFSEELQFALETSKRGELSALDFKLIQMVKGEKLTTDIMSSKGGGVVSVAAFLLRVLILMAARPALRQLLVLDESFAMVSQEFVPNLASLLRQIVDETGIQILMVTHEPAYGAYADKVYEVSQNEGESVYAVVKSHASRTVSS